jgi:mRNA-degrading endonuclease RelE of RelBE toxin-antitoxin system
MDSYKIRLARGAEEELRAAPFPFRRQLNQAVFKLKEAPRPPHAELIEADAYRLSVHGWFLLYEVDDDSRTVTLFRVYQ